MTRTLTAAAVLVLCLAMVPACGGSSSALADIGANLKGPSGAKASLYATGIKKVAALAFDAKGRLWVSTAEFTDSGDDGLYLVAQSGAAPVAVLTGLHTAMGLLWIGDTLYVSSKEKVEAYSSFDGTTFGEHHTVVSLPSGVGEVNGMVLSGDGRIFLGISSPCDHCVPASEYSASVVSFLPDGSGLRIDAKGIRAPIGFAYVTGTNDLLVTMNQRDDLGDKTPGDWLAVVQSGQSWGFPDCYGQGGAACTGVPSPVAELDKHAAVSGVAMWNGKAIVAEWQTGKVQQVTLTKNASTYTGKVAPLLTGVTNPVPVVVGPDNALYVGDWTSGTIYRVTAS
jgi:glucose/arabinose dehydrogenase